MSMSIDWKARAEAAEAALERARRHVVLTPTRKAVLRALGQLRPGEEIATEALAERLQAGRRTTYDSLQLLWGVGLVDRPAGRHGGRGHRVHWRLGYMVQVPE